MKVLPRSLTAPTARLDRHPWAELQDMMWWHSMTETQRPSLITNPADDLAFRDDAEAALREGRSIEDLQTILRRDYPRAVVRSRDLAGERPVMWYVYREGHWVPRHDPGQG
jgi:hypothetical protein